MRSPTVRACEGVSSQALRPAVWILLGALAGCGGGEAADLFSDDFSSGSLVAKWVVSGETAGSGTISSDPSLGNAAPSAWFSRPAGSSAVSPTLTSNATFTPGGGLTISFQAATRAGGSLLVRADGGNCYGNVEIFPTKVQYGLKSGNFNIQGTQNINLDTGFHTYVFQVTPGGVPSVSRDGQVQLTSQASAACTADSSIFRIVAFVNQPDDVLGVSSNLDNVHVGRP